MNGFFLFRTMGSASSRNTSNASFRCSSGSTRARITRARASVWPFAEKSQNDTGERFGWNHIPGRVRHFAKGEEGEMNSGAIEIVVGEDNPGDVRLTLEAFKEGEVPNHFTVMND